MNTYKRIATLALMLAAAVSAMAGTSANNTNTVSPTLNVSVNVQKAIQLTLGSGAGCTVSAGTGTDYSIDFGTVDALAINNGTCGSKFAPTTPGSTNAVYYTDYTIKPVFTSQAVSTNTITAYVSTNFGLANLSVVQSNSAPAAITDLSAMSTNAATPTTVATNASNATSITRYVGVSVAPTNGASMTGSSSATITYTLTVQ